MHNKIDLKLYFERVLLMIKAQKLAGFVPILFIDLLIPILNLLIYFSKGEGAELTLSVNQLLQLFMPFLSCWWVIFALRLFVEEKGCEVFFVSSDKTKMFDIFALFLIMLSNICLTSIPYFFVIERFWETLLRIILVCFFYFGVSYCVSLLTKSITSTLFLLTIYTLANTLSPLKETLFPFYYSPEVSPNIFLCEVPLFISGILLLLIGKTIIKQKSFY